ncbi:MAG: transcription antitermination factor NusB [Candidatus Eremiobacteraeota bacterium]|nr:transcription antitermination factor NusB [Candidatus Eremiobacteraeota bacterium]
MKTGKRTKAREFAFKTMFSSQVGKHDILDVLESTLEHDDSKGIKGEIEKRVITWNKNRKEIDSIIEKHLRKGTLRDVPNVALCALRLGICEMEYFDDVPAEVAINEIVEISKKFGNESISGFVNAIMDERLKSRL